MSYILDALRKADAQRVRNPARGIHAQASTATANSPATGVRREHGLWGGAAVLILLAAAWLWVSGSEPMRVASAPAPAAQVAIVQPPVSQAPMPAAPAAQVLPAPPPVTVVPAPVAPATPVAAAVAAPRPPAVEVARPEPAATVADRIFTVAELPADVQQAFPKLSISGGVFSENIAQRMLIVNGQVFNEGSEVAPGVVLELLRPKSAVLKFRGLRVSQPY